MPTPIQLSKSDPSGMGKVFALLLLLGLLGGEYYLLTTQDAKLHPPAPRVRTAKQIAYLEKQKVLRKIYEADSARSAHRTGAKGAKAGAKQPAKDKEGGLDLDSMFGKKEGEGPGLLGQAMETIQGIEDQHGGLALRFILILVCVALLFLQTLPTPKVGAPRRFARNPKTIEVPLQFIRLVLGFSGLVLLIMGGCTGIVLLYGYPLAAGICLMCGMLGGQLRATTIPVEGKLMGKKIRRDTEYGIILNAERGRFVNIPNPFRGTLVLGGAGAGKTYSIGEPFLEQFLQRGMCGVIYDFKFPVLAGAAQKAMLYAQPAHEKLLALYQEDLKNGAVRPRGLARPIRHRVINFLDMTRTEKVNPLRPQDMPTPAYAMEYAQTILTNLSPQGAIGITHTEVNKSFSTLGPIEL